VLCEASSPLLYSWVMKFGTLVSRWSEAAVVNGSKKLWVTTALW